jgi:transposase-like protein
MLAQGYTQAEVSAEIGVCPRTLRYWNEAIEFSAEVDRLSLMVDIASRAERLRLSMRVMRQKTKDGEVQTEKDALDWLKFAQSETDGIKLDLAAVAEAATSMANGG